MKRRDLISSASAIALTAFVKNSSVFGAEQSSKKNNKPFSFCLNTSTIRGQNQGIVKDMETAAKAGFNGIEIWINGLQEYQQKGGSASELRKKAQDLGLTIEDAIGFAPWIVDDNTQRKNAQEQLKKEMGLLASIGCRRIAAPPFGATNEPGLNLDAAAERFYTIAEIGRQEGVLPQLELWGFSKNLNKLSQVLYVAAESGHPQAHILADIYHLYKGGSDFDSVKLLSSHAIEIFHVNDYPKDFSRENIKDSDRVHLGDGIAPLKDILSNLVRPNKTIVLSLELFNPEYYKLDALAVAKLGLQRMKEACAGVSAS